MFYTGMLNGAFTEVLRGGDMLTMHVDIDTGVRRLVLLTSRQHAEIVVREASGTYEQVARQHAGVFAVVTGNDSRLSGAGYAIDDTRELIQIDIRGLGRDRASGCGLALGPRPRSTTHPLGVRFSAASSSCSD